MTWPHVNVCSDVQGGIPSTVPGPHADFLHAVEAPPGADPRECGRRAREAVDRRLTASAAILFENLPIAHDEAAAGDFVEALGFQVAKYEPFGGARKKVRPGSSL